MKICILIKKYLFPAQGGVLALTSEIISDENVITTLGNEETLLCTFNSPSVCSYRLDTLKVFNTHMQTKQIVLPSAWWSTHYFHLALKCISSRKRMWRPLERESSANHTEGPWEQKASTAHEDASRPVWEGLRTSEWLCSLPTLPSGKATNRYTVSPRDCKDRIRKELDDSPALRRDGCKDTIWQQSGSSSHGWDDQKQLLAQLGPFLTAFPFSPKKYLFRGRSVIKPLQGKQCIQ